LKGRLLKVIEFQRIKLFRNGCNLPPALRVKIKGLATNLKSLLLMKKATSKKINYIAAQLTSDTHLWGQNFNHHGSGLSSACHCFFGAV
jgi:hypothetical protein